VEFANRQKLKDLIQTILSKIEQLRESFVSGNVLKRGISTVIAGKPNAGKSTLLNALLKEERAIVTEIEGTTRDTIEEVFVLNGVQFRLIDTAGLRETEDAIEQIGVTRSLEKMEQAELLVYMYDASKTSDEQLQKELDQLPEKEYLFIVANKTDQKPALSENHISISAKTRNIESLIERLENLADAYKNSNETLVNNVRHVDALQKSSVALKNSLHGLDIETSSDLIALDIRNALYQLGLITGEVTNDEVLSSIFGRFCIGK
jgi:tRNA modification GTPase